MSRKTMSFRQLLNYIDGPEQKGAPLLHNFGAAQAPEEIRQELIRNGHLLPSRKNGNLLYHEILSFGEGDRADVTPGLLADVTTRYLELRAPYALGYARAHLDTENPHVHLLISANNVGSSERLRLPKARFRKIQIELERYQQERYPALTNSLAQQTQGRSDQVRQNWRERAREHRLVEQSRRQPSKKDRLRGLLLRELGQSNSGESYYRALVAQGHRLYRRGRSIGIEELETGRRYRLKTLGLQRIFQEALTRWQQAPERLKVLEQLELDHRQRTRDGPELER